MLYSNQYQHNNNAAYYEEGNRTTEVNERPVSNTKIAGKQFKFTNEPIFVRITGLFVI